MNLNQVFLKSETFLKVRHRLFGWTEEGAGAEGGNRLLWMKERKFAVDYKEQSHQDFSEAPEEKVEQSLDVRSQIDWWDTRADEEPEPTVEKCPLVLPFALIFCF